MRVVVTGATGNVGTSVLSVLAAEPSVDSIVGLARRIPDVELPKVTWAAADVTSSDLDSHFEGADAVVHLAWAIQPSHRPDALEAVNVRGSARVLEAVGRSRVLSFVYASSVGAYSPGPKDPPVDEGWPVGGIASSFYSRHKSTVERMLDGFEAEQPHRRVVRLRPALIFKREAATGVRRLFIGPLVPPPLLRPGRLPVVPRMPPFQAVHSLDVAEAYRLALVSDVRGPFNIAADPVIGPEELGRALSARVVPVPMGVLRVGADVSWRLRLQPTPDGWVDLAEGSPILDSGRARRELGWNPRVGGDEALRELMQGLADRAAAPTPPLAPSTRPAEA